MPTLLSFLESRAPTELNAVFGAIKDASIIVSAEVNRAGLGADIYGAKGTENVQGEQQQKLDVYADEVFAEAFRKSGQIVGLASEEVDDALFFEENAESDYVIMIDPLDGSSNIDVNVAIGTIFAIYKRRSPIGGPVSEDDFLQPGNEMVAAGYVSYSVSTQMVFSVGEGLHIFTLDPKHGDYHLVSENVRIPSDGKVYSINEVNYDDFDHNLQEFVQYCRDKRKGDGTRKYTGRYIGSLVADFHRNLLKGGIYVYPSTVEAPKGKLRLLYECNPMSFLVEQAGGYGTDGVTRTLDIVPTELHQRCPFFVGSPVMMDEVMKG